MDEYLFITLAKLKADRVTLERQARRAEPDSEQLQLQWVEPEQRRAPLPRPARRSVLARWFSQQPLWREQS